MLHVGLWAQVERRRAVISRVVVCRVHWTHSFIILVITQLSHSAPFPCRISSMWRKSRLTATCARHHIPHQWTVPSQ